MVFFQPAAVQVIEVLSEAGWERVLDNQLVDPAAVRGPLGSQGQRAVRALAAEPVGELEPVRHEERPDLSLQQGPDDLMPDLSSLARGGPGEGLVEEHEAVRPDPAGDLAHAPELL